MHKSGRFGGGATCSLRRGLEKNIKMMYNSNMRNYRFKGFTLAEVLITLGIIGVVAALTIPTLVNNYEKKLTVTQLRKVYSDLHNAVNLSEVENGPMEQWDYPTAYTNDYEQIAPFIEQYFLPYFKSAKLIKASELNDYVILPRVGYPGSNEPIITNYLILNNGVILSFFANLPASYFWLFADINGEKAPNVVGRDIFVFDIYKSGTQDNINNGTAYNRYKLKFWYYYKRREDLINTEQYRCNKNNTERYKNFTCGRLIELDGWKISDDYPW